LRASLRARIMVVTGPLRSIVMVIGDPRLV
jgi:hypothetical protein